MARLVITKEETNSLKMVYDGTEYIIRKGNSILLSYSTTMRIQLKEGYNRIGLEMTFAISDIDVDGATTTSYSDFIAKVNTLVPDFFDTWNAGGGTPTPPIGSNILRWNTDANATPPQLTLSAGVEQAIPFAGTPFQIGANVYEYNVDATHGEFNATANRLDISGVNPYSTILIELKLQANTLINSLKVIIRHYDAQTGGNIVYQSEVVQAIRSSATPILLFETPKITGNSIGIFVESSQNDTLTYLATFVKITELI